MTRLSIMLFLIAFPLSAQQRDFPSITASGSAEIKVVPDIIEIAVGVETVNAELAKAKADNDAAVAKVIATAKERKIDAGKIKTDYIALEPNYAYEDRRRVVTYTARKSIVIESSDLAGFESLITALVEAGANHVHGVQFKTSELRKHRDEARRLAIKAAQEKAKLLAEGLGRSVGNAHSISEGYDYWGSSYGSWWGGRWSAGSQNVVQVANAAARGDADGSLAPGRISVTASVSVTFLLE